MTALRCTSRLLRRLRVANPPEPGPAENALGHWYANLLMVDRRNFVLAISENSLLAVIVPGAPFSSVIPRFEQDLRELLMHLGVPQERCEEELAAQAPMIIAKTANRRVIGALNDVQYSLEADFHYHPGRSLLERQLRLTRHICSVTKYRYPGDLALELLGLGKTS